MIEELAEEHHLFGKRGCDTIFVTFPFFLPNANGWDKPDIWMAKTIIPRPDSQ